MRKTGIVFNTAVLTLSSLILRLLGLSFQIFLAAKLGKEGVGLLHLVLSVSGFAATLAISGIRFATTRLISEELGKRETGNIVPLMRRCLSYAALCGIGACVFLLFSAEPIGLLLIGDARTAEGMRLLAVGLPFISVGACLSGYFLGVGRPYKSAVGALTDQIIEIAAASALLALCADSRQETAVNLVVLADCAGNAISAALLFILYLRDVKDYRAEKSAEAGLTGRILGITVPLALAAYFRTALSSVQNALVPRGLRRSGATAEESLSAYGAIQGMAFPIVTFPSVVFAAVSELIVPDMTEKQAGGRQGDITRTANALMRCCLVFSIAVAGFLWAGGEQLGLIFYGDGGAGEFVKELALLMPVMYMDHITDGMLRGLGEHLYSMRLNIVDSLLSLALMFFLLPKFAVRGYITVLYASEIFNFTFSILRLTRKAKLEGLFRTATASALSALGAANLVSVMIGFCSLSGVGGIVTSFAVYAAVFTACETLFGVFTAEELDFFKKKCFPGISARISVILKAISKRRKQNGNG